MAHGVIPVEGSAVMGIGEASFRALADGLDDCVFLADRNGCYLAVNRPFAAWLGRPESEIVGRTAFDFWPYALAQRDALDDLRALDGESVEREEQRPRGEEMRTVRSLRAPVRDDDGAVAAVLGTFRDLKPAADSDEARLSARMELIGRLAGGVAHDFNNLLTAVLGHLALLRDCVPAVDPHQELLGGAEKAAGQAAALSRQLLAFMRSEPDGPTGVDLNGVVREVVGLLRRTFDPRIRLDIRPQPELPSILAFPTQMAQLLLNLCLNARDAMPRGGRLLVETGEAVISADAARLHPQRRPGAFVRLRVADTGEGIPSTVQARMFDAAFTTKGPGQGTGLGLAIVRSVVQEHRGWIECLSSPGQGARFDVYLPSESAD